MLDKLSTALTLQRPRVVLEPTTAQTHTPLEFWRIPSVTGIDHWGFFNVNPIPPLLTVTVDEEVGLAVEKLKLAALAFGWPTRQSIAEKPTVKGR